MLGTRTCSMSLTRAASEFGAATKACRRIRPSNLQCASHISKALWSSQQANLRFTAPMISVSAIPRRSFTTTPSRHHGHIKPPRPGEELYVTFIEKDGGEHKFAVSEGDNLLDIAQANDLEMEGACGGSCACSTCHVIVADGDRYDRIPEPDDDENDMLDLAFGLTETSRLGCQVKMTKALDGLVVKLPSMTRNLQASDFQQETAR